MISETILELIRKDITSLCNKLYSNLKFKDKVNRVNDKEFILDKTKNVKFGDFYCNIAMVIAKNSHDTLEIAELIKENINKKHFDKIEITKPGFLNFFLKKELYQNKIKEAIELKDNFGKFKPKKLHYNIEFVSANPTGLLHIGHARNGAYGDSLARILNWYGVNVDREYYINDAGNQIEKLALSTLIRYLQLFDKKVNLPEDSYHGKEIKEVAQKLKEKFGDLFVNTAFDDNKIQDKVANRKISNFAKDYMLKIIKQTLSDFKVDFDIFFSEKQIYKGKILKNTIKLLKDYTYKSENALWLKTTDFKDDKDRVLVKADGSYTYFMPDIVYHNIKFSRGYDKLFDILGADHGGYVSRLKAAMECLGNDSNKLNVLIMQMVRLTKDGKEFKLSKRSGNSFTLEDLVQLIGQNEARWYLVAQGTNTHVEIDIDQTKKQSADNPIYYVQYAHARINQVLNKEKYEAPNNFDDLKLDIERDLMNNLFYFEHTISQIFKSYEVNKLNLYLYNLAKLFHNYYANNKIIDENNKTLSAQRYYLCAAIKQIIANGLRLLGITPVDKM